MSLVNPRQFWTADVYAEARAYVRSRVLEEHPVIYCWIWRQAKSESSYGAATFKGVQCTALLDWHVQAQILRLYLTPFRQYQPSPNPIGQFPDVACPPVT